MVKLIKILRQRRVKRIFLHSLYDDLIKIKFIIMNNYIDSLDFSIRGYVYVLLSSNNGMAVN